MFYSKTTGGFYCVEINGDNIPLDAVEISNDDHKRLLDGQSIGKMIASDVNGTPILIDPPVEITQSVDPVQKLKMFLISNPDVAKLIAQTSASTEPLPADEPQVQSPEIKG
jgi:hypothetical protein